MSRWPLAFVSLCLVLVLVLPLKAVSPDDEMALAAKIDQLISARCQEAGVQPVPVADDAEFLRRVYLDLIGRIPSTSEARTFLGDSTPDKRHRLVRQLLSHPGYVEHFSNVWRDLLVPEARTNAEVQGQLTGFNAWIGKQLTQNVGYDRMVRELLTLRFAGERVRSRKKPATEEPKEEATPLAFYLAKEVKPENLAGSTARLFLGVRLECAQCHDHPTAPWTRQQFWSYAAFFASLQRNNPEEGNTIREIFDRRELKIPGSTQTVEARYPDGTEPQWRYNIGSRTTLADWLTTPANPYFSRTAANRLWAHLFGIGLVEPVDDLRTDNPPSHPELLDELARQLAAHQFDTKYLIRAITASQTYQRTSARSGIAADPLTEAGRARLFARMALKALTAEQLFDSLALATGYRAPEPPRDSEQIAPPRNEDRSEFLALFAPTGQTPVQVQTSIQQALTLMNGRFIAAATRGQRDGTLATAANDPSLDTQGRIEALFLATLSRRPTAKETARLVRYVASGGAQKDPQRALADVFWVLLNSTEFCVNH